MGTIELAGQAAKIGSVYYDATMLQHACPCQKRSVWASNPARVQAVHAIFSPGLQQMACGSSSSPARVLTSIGVVSVSGQAKAAREILTAIIGRAAAASAEHFGIRRRIRSSPALSEIVWAQQSVDNSAQDDLIIGLSLQANYIYFGQARGLTRLTCPPSSLCSCARCRRTWSQRAVKLSFEG